MNSTQGWGSTLVIFKRPTVNFPNIFQLARTGIPIYKHNINTRSTIEQPQAQWFLLKLPISNGMVSRRATRYGSHTYWEPVRPKSDINVIWRAGVTVGPDSKVCSEPRPFLLTPVLCIENLWGTMQSIEVKWGKMLLLSLDGSPISATLKHVLLCIRISSPLSFMIGDYR